MGRRISRNAGRQPAIADKIYGPLSHRRSQANAGIGFAYKAVRILWRWRQRVSAPMSVGEAKGAMAMPVVALVAVIRVNKRPLHRPSCLAPVRQSLPWPGLPQALLAYHLRYELC